MADSEQNLRLRPAQKRAGLTHKFCITTVALRLAKARSGQAKNPPSVHGVKGELKNLLSLVRFFAAPRAPRDNLTDCPTAAL